MPSHQPYIVCVSMCTNVCVCVCPMCRELESALTTALSQPHSTRARAFLRLVQLLQLHVLGSPDTAPDTALLYDLRRVCQEALNLNLPALEEEAVGDGEGTASDEDQEVSTHTHTHIYMHTHTCIYIHICLP